MLRARVNYDNPEHHHFDHRLYSSVEEGLGRNFKFDFQVRGVGKADIAYEYVDFNHTPTLEEVILQIKRRNNLRLPDFAETRDFHSQNPNEQKMEPIVSVCGGINHLEDYLYYAHGMISADRCGLHLYKGFPAVRFGWERRFLTVRK